jgi:hypothetical protein
MEMRGGASLGQGAAVRRLGPGVGAGRGAERAMAAQEGLEDADRRSVGLGQFGWLAHQGAVERQRVKALRFKRLLDARVERFDAPS